MEAVASGRKVKDSPSRSRKVYISLPTMSVVSPMERAKSSVRSRTGMRTSENPKRSNLLLASDSTTSHFSISPGRISLNPRIPLIGKRPSPCFQTSWNIPKKPFTVKEELSSAHSAVISIAWNPAPDEHQDVSGITPGIRHALSHAPIPVFCIFFPGSRQEEIGLKRK